jgi:hypothetical protein
MNYYALAFTPLLLLLPACTTPKFLKNLRASVTFHGTMNEENDEFEIKRADVLVSPRNS